MIAWDGSTFCKSQEKSKQLIVAMKRLSLENQMASTRVTLPDGISKNDIIIDFINSIYIEERSLMIRNQFFIIMKHLTI